MAWKRWLAVSLLLGFVVAGAPVAQEEVPTTEPAPAPEPEPDKSTGRIAGRVFKEDRGVGGVTVLVNELKTVEITDSQGDFRFTKVPPGTYTLIFTLGDNSLTRTDVKVSAGLTTELPVEIDWITGIHETLTVYGASRRLEKIVDAPAAVTVVQEEQIEQGAATGQLLKTLEFSPGAEVTQSGLYDFNFNTRGFNSSLNRRVAVFLDGRDTSAPFLGAQEWSALSSPLDDVSTVEFIRGPSAALYGQNASSGVVNMTSRAPRDSQGGTVRLTLGELATANLDLRYATSLGKGWYTRVLLGLRDTEDFTISRNESVEYSRPCSSDELIDPGLRETPCLPQEAIPLLTDTNKIVSTGLRLDKYLAEDSVITMEGGWGNIEGPVFQTGIGRVATVDSKRPWFRVGHSRPHWNVLASFSERVGVQQSLQSEADIFTESQRYHLELQTNWDLSGGKGRIIGGAAYIKEEIDTAGPDGEQTLLLAPVESDRQALFAQFDWKFNPVLKLVLAARYDQSTLHDPFVSPKAAMVFSITPQQSIRLTYNRAFQVANYSEFFLFAQVTNTEAFAFLDNLCVQNGTKCGFSSLPVMALGNENLDLEVTEGWEVGYSAVIGKRAFLTVDYYRSDNTQFITDLLPQFIAPLEAPDFKTNPAIPDWVARPDWNDIQVSPDQTLADVLSASLNFLGRINGVQPSNDPRDNSTIVVARTYTNFGEVSTQGVDLGFSYFFSDALNLRFSYSWFDFEPKESNQPIDPEIQDRLLLANTPENKFSLVLSYRKPRWGIGIAGRWVEDFPWSAGLFEGPVADNQPNSFSSSPYSTADLTGDYMVTDKWKLGLVFSNVFGQRNYQAFGGDLLDRRALIYGQFDW